MPTWQRSSKIYDHFITECRVNLAIAMFSEYSLKIKELNSFESNPVSQRSPWLR